MGSIPESVLTGTMESNILLGSSRGSAPFTGGDFLYWHRIVVAGHNYAIFMGHGGKLMNQAMIRVWLPVTDPEEVSTYFTLTKTMGLPLVKLSSNTLWELEIAPQASDLKAYIQRMIDETGIFVNPNRDRYEIFCGYEGLDRQGSAPGHHVRWTIVYNGDGAEPQLAEKLRLRYGFTAVKSVRRGRLWWLELKTDDAISADAILQQALVTKSRWQGLLANPHAQTWIVV